MAEVTIYTTMFCPYCWRAKKLLESKGVQFHEIDVDTTPGAREEMVKRAGGRRSVPQVFIAGDYVGDCDGIHALDARGELDPLLTSAA